MKRRIVLLGSPASGKGTQAELIQKRFGIRATSTGAILRAEAKSGTPVGLGVAKIISKGALARRMEEYREKTVPGADFYRRRDILARVAASRTAEAVVEDVSELIAA